MKDNKLIAEFMGAEIEIWKAHERLGDDTSKDAWYAYFDGNGVAVEELAYDTSWDWLMPVVREILTTIELDNLDYDTGELRYNTLDCDISGAYKEVVEFIKNQNK